MPPPVDNPLSSVLNHARRNKGSMSSSSKLNPRMVVRKQCGGANWKSVIKNIANGSLEVSMVDGDSFDEDDDKSCDEEMVLESKTSPTNSVSPGPIVSLRRSTHDRENADQLEDSMNSEVELLPSIVSMTD